MLRAEPYRSVDRMPPCLYEGSRGAFDAIFRANSSTDRRRSRLGTTSFTSPITCASPASIMLPVKSIFIDALRPTFLANATIGVEQNRPIFTPGVANRASSDAMARSHVATNWHPAAVAIPCTSAITGLGLRVIATMRSEQRLIVSLKNESPLSGSCRARVSSLRSWPEQKPCPFPERTITRTSGDSPSLETASLSRWSIAMDRLLRLSGRLSARRAIMPSRDSSTISFVKFSLSVFD